MQKNPNTLYDINKDKLYWLNTDLCTGLLQSSFMTQCVVAASEKVFSYLTPTIN